MDNDVLHRRDLRTLLLYVQEGVLLITNHDYSFILLSALFDVRVPSPVECIFPSSLFMSSVISRSLEHIL